MIAPIEFVVFLIWVLFASARLANSSSDDELARIELELFGDGKSPSIILTPEETLERVKRAHTLLLERRGDEKELMVLKYNIGLLMEAGTINEKKCTEQSLDRRRMSVIQTSGYSYAVVTSAYMKRLAQLQFAYCATHFARDQQLEENTRGQLELLVETIDGIQATADQSSKGEINVPVPDELTMAKGILAFLDGFLEPFDRHSLTRQQFDRSFEARIASLCRQVNKALVWGNVLEKFLGSDLLDLVDEKILYWIRANGICWRTYGAKSLAFIIAPTPEAHSSLGASDGETVMCSAESLAEIYFTLRDKTRDAIKTNQTLSDRIRVNLSNCTHRITIAATALLEEQELKELAGFASMVNRALGFTQPGERGIRTLAKGMIRMMKRTGGQPTNRSRFRQMSKEQFQERYFSVVDQVCSARIVDQLEQPATMFFLALETDEKLLSLVHNEALELVKALETCNEVKLYLGDVWNLYQKGIESKWDMIFARQNERPLS